MILRVSSDAAFRRLQINFAVVIAMHKPLCYIEFNGSFAARNDVSSTLLIGVD